MVALSLVLPGVVNAATVSADIPMRGAAVYQRFLPDGASVVTTASNRVCMTSRRIDIAASDYRDPDGTAVAFDQVIRSPATVIQALAVAGGARSFRIQLKFSPKPGAPLTLELPDGARDISALIEASTDSVLIEGALADDLAAAFGAGARTVLRSLSRDTGRTVTDHIDAPDLAALDDCTRSLAASQDGAGTDRPSMVVRAVFDAQKRPESIATPGQLQACGMPAQPETLYLGRLRNISGFVSHTDKIFVSFNAAGQVERAYIPGIFDVDLRPGQGSLRVSRAADGNVPADPNTVSGCIGAETMAVCPTDLGGGAYALTACAEEGLTGFLSSREFTPSQRAGVPPSGFSTGRGRSTPPGGGFGGGGGFVPVPGTPGTPTPPKDPTLISVMSSMFMSGQTPPPPPPPPLSPVPLPAGMWLMLLALGGLFGLRARRAKA